MKHIKIIIAALCTILLSQPLLSQTSQIDDLWAKAEQQYKAQQYEDATESYRQLLNYGISAPLYYNYANALLKSGHIGESILNYERALRLAPNNDNIRFNLDFANNLKTDQIDPIQPFFMSQWITSLEKVLTTNEWAYTAIISFIVTLILVMVYLFGKITWLRKTAFFTALAALIISVCSLSYSLSSKQHALERNEAIVMAGSVSVKSSPDESGTEVFVLHEGTKVTIRTSITGWHEIRIADGNIGWLETTAIEVI